MVTVTVTQLLLQSNLPTQARSQDLEKGGYFERVRSVQTTLTRIVIALESSFIRFARKLRRNFSKTSEI